MKKTITGSFLLLLAGVGLLKAQEQTLSLEGRILTGKTEYIYLHRFENKIFTVIDSAKVKKGKFSFSGKRTLPDLYGLSGSRDEIPYYVFLDEGSNKVDFDLDNKNKGTRVEGSPSQELYQAYKSQEKPVIKEFIQAHPNSIVSSYLLYREWSYRLSPEQLEANLALLSEAQQQSRYSKALREIIAVARKVAVGNKAPAIEAQDAEGNVQSLYNHLGKYTLIDFWASWCPPCRRENPNIVANYAKYKDQGFAIYAVSLDKNKEAWLKGIKDDNLTWTHVSELKYWDSEVAAHYAVRAIPANFLVDEQGTILAKNLRGERLGQVLDSLLNSKGSVAAGLKKDFKGQDPIAYVSTESQVIEKQEKGTFSPDKRLFFANDYDGARLKAVQKTSDGIYHVLVAPEKTPINQSPWYGFQVWSDKDTLVHIQLDYASGFRHRYNPKVSLNGINWQSLASVQLVGEDGTKSARFSLPVSKGKTWVSAQPNIPTHAVYTWIEQVNKQVPLRKEEAGKTALGKPLYVYGAGNAASEKRLLVMGRQHPPEITGHYAYVSFVEYLLSDAADAKAFRDNYYIYFIPVVNPDGVDLGHWRTNANGVDLNRDWDAFKQPESRAIRDYIAKEVKDKGRELYFAIDFHSTGSDIFYTIDPNLPTRIAQFVPNWISSLKEAIPGYEPLVKPLYFEGPTYTAYSYFYKNYQAESLVYEIGDDTDRQFITQKANLSAKHLIEKLNESNTID